MKYNILHLFIRTRFRKYVNNTKRSSDRCVLEFHNSSQLSIVFPMNPFVIVYFHYCIDMQSQTCLPNECALSYCLFLACLSHYIPLPTIFYFIMWILYYRHMTKTPPSFYLLIISICICIEFNFVFFSSSSSNVAFNSPFVYVNDKWMKRNTAQLNKTRKIQSIEIQILREKVTPEWGETSSIWKETELNLSLIRSEIGEDKANDLTKLLDIKLTE